jgi:hypothetical protein
MVGRPVAQRRLCQLRRVQRSKPRPSGLADSMYLCHVIHQLPETGVGLADEPFDPEWLLDTPLKSPWPESVSELYRPSDPRLSTKLVPTFSCRGVPRGQRDGSLRPYSRFPRPEIYPLL